MSLKNNLIMLNVIFLFILFTSGCLKTDNKNTEVDQMSKFQIKSVFENNTKIQEKYTCKGENINPPVSISGIPSNAKTLALIVDDPDAPAGTWDHWIVFNIPIINKIDEDSIPGIEGLNSFRRNNYGGPCPPSGTHRYYFKIYALNTLLKLSGNSNKKDLC